MSITSGVSGIFTSIYDLFASLLAILQGVIVCIVDVVQDLISQAVHLTSGVTKFVASTYHHDRSPVLRAPLVADQACPVRLQAISSLWPSADCSSSPTCATRQAADGPWLARRRSRAPVLPFFLGATVPLIRIGWRHAAGWLGLRGAYISGLRDR